MPRDWPFALERFDKILLSSVLQMVEDDKTLLQECRRILKRKGTLVLSVPTEYVHLKRLNYFKSQLKKKFGALGKAYYDYNKVVGLLLNEGFGNLNAVSLLQHRFERHLPRKRHITD